MHLACHHNHVQCLCLVSSFLLLRCLESPIALEQQERNFHLWNVKKQHFCWRIPGLHAFVLSLSLSLHLSFLGWFLFTSAHPTGVVQAHFTGVCERRRDCQLSSRVMTSQWRGGGISMSLKSSF